MNIYTDINQIPYIECGVVSVGTFDGVHKAHRIILKEVSSLAKSIGGQSVVITFASHPRMLIDPDFDIKILTARQEKNILFEQIGIDNVVYLQFNRNIAEMSYADFIDMLSSKIDIVKIVVGYDHNFGKNREGNLSRLRQLTGKYCFEVVEVSKQTVAEMDVKSSVIRDAIKKGDILSANHLLGYEYEVELAVFSIQQDKVSLKMNNPEKLLPCDGIYPIEIKGNPVLLEIKTGNLSLLENNLLFGAKEGTVFIIKFSGNSIESTSPKI